LLSVRIKGKVVVGYFFVRLWFSVYIVPVKHCPLVQIHSPYREVEQLLLVVVETVTATITTITPSNPNAATMANIAIDVAVVVISLSSLP